MKVKTKRTKPCLMKMRGMPIEEVIDFLINGKFSTEIQSPNNIKKTFEKKGFFTEEFIQNAVESSKLEAVRASMQAAMVEINGNHIQARLWQHTTYMKENSDGTVEKITGYGKVTDMDSVQLEVAYETIISNCTSFLTRAKADIDFMKQVAIEKGFYIQMEFPWEI